MHMEIKSSINNTRKIIININIYFLLLHIHPSAI